MKTLRVASAVAVVWLGVACCFALAEAANRKPPARASMTGNVYSLEILHIDGEPHGLDIGFIAQEGSLKEPVVWLEMERLQTALETLPEVKFAVSFADILKEVVRALSSADSESARIPADRATLGWYVEMIYSPLKENDLVAYVSKDKRIFHLRVFLRDGDGWTKAVAAEATRQFCDASRIFHLSGSPSGESGPASLQCDIPSYAGADLAADEAKVRAYLNQVGWTVDSSTD